MWLGDEHFVAIRPDKNGVVLAVQLIMVWCSHTTMVYTAEVALPAAPSTISSGGSGTPRPPPSIHDTPRPQVE